MSELDTTSEKKKGTISMPLWNSTPFWGIVGLIGGAVISTLLALIWKPKKRLHYQRTTTQLITEQMISTPTFEVTIDNTTIRSLTSTKIEFYNAGNQIIYPKDFVPLEPLEIKVTENSFSLSECFTIKSNYKNCNPRIEATDEDRDARYVKFDFLRPKQAFSVTILHDGNLSVLGDLTDGKVLELEKMYCFFSRTLRIECILGSAVLLFFSIYLCQRNQLPLSLQIMGEPIIFCAILLLFSLIMTPLNLSYVVKSISNTINRFMHRNRDN